MRLGINCKVNKIFYNKISGGENPPFIFGEIMIEIKNLTKKFENKMAQVKLL